MISFRSLLWLGGLTLLFTFYLSYLASSRPYGRSIDDTLTVIKSERRPYEEKLLVEETSDKLMLALESAVTGTQGEGELNPPEQIEPASLPPEPLPPDVSISGLLEQENKESGQLQLSENDNYDDLDSMRMNQPDLNLPETFPPELLLPETNIPDYMNTEILNSISQPPYEDTASDLLSADINFPEYVESEILKPETNLPDYIEPDIFKPQSQDPSEDITSDLFPLRTNFPDNLDPGLFKPESPFPYEKTIDFDSLVPETIPAEYMGSDELHPDTFLPDLPSELPTPESLASSVIIDSSELRFDFSQTARNESETQMEHKILKVSEQDTKNKNDLNSSNGSPKSNVLVNEVIDFQTQSVSETQATSSKPKTPQVEKWPEVQASARNRTPSDARLLLYNRVSKCGSTTVKTLLESLSRKNGFSHTSWAVYGERALVGELEEQFVTSLQRQLEKNGRRLSVDRHVYFVDFAKYNQPLPVYINMLRDPIERTMSSFYYARSPKRWDHLKNSDLDPRDVINLGGKVEGNKTELVLPSPEWFNKSFTECVMSGDAECSFVPGSTRETIVSYFCGSDPPCLIVSGKEGLQRAKFNLENFYSVVGVLEELEKSLDVMEKFVPAFLSGMSNAYAKLRKEYRQRNRTPHPELPASVVEVLRRNLTADLELYQFAKQRLHAQLAKVDTKKRPRKKNSKG